MEYAPGDVEKRVPATPDVTSVMASLAETNVPHSGLSSLGEVGKGDEGVKKWDGR